MKNQRLKLTAIKALLFAALLGSASLSWAEAVGTVTHLSGPLVAKKANGTVKVLAVKSEVENGDTLVSEKNTYAQIKFIDNGQITLRPGTTFKIENYAYNADKPEADVENLELIKGGVRSVTGLLGKRNKEKFALKTPSATIGIRGTTFIAQYVPPSRPTADDMRIDYNPSAMETNPGNQGKTGSSTQLINRSPDGGDPNITVTGKQPAANTGGTGTAGGDPAVLAGNAVNAALNAGGGNSTTTPLPGQKPQGTGSSTPGTGIASQLGSLVNGGAVGPNPPPANGNPGPLNGLGTVSQAGPPMLAPGLHLQVTDGAIVVTNNGGSQGFQAGQFGYVPNVNQPPVIVPPNSGIQFVPPPSFNSGSGGPTASNGPGQGQATDCIVR